MMVELEDEDLLDDFGTLRLKLIQALMWQEESVDEENLGKAIVWREEDH